MTARAVEGAATEAALRAVADALGVRRARVELVHGRTSRDKLVEIRSVDGPEDETRMGVRLAELLGQD